MTTLSEFALTSGTVTRWGRASLTALSVWAAVAGLASPGLSSAADETQRPMPSQKSERTLVGLTVEDTVVQAWTRQGQIVKVRAIVKAEHGRTTFEFEWRGGQLRQLRDLEINYGEAVTGEPLDGPGATRVARNDVFVVQPGSPPRWTAMGGRRPDDAVDGAERFATLRRWAESLHLLMSSPTDRVAASTTWSCAVEWDDGLCTKFNPN